MEPAQLETLLGRCALDASVARVVSVQTELALPKGENYLSTIKRISLEVVLGDGSVSRKSLILKEVPHEEVKRQFVTGLGVFKMEIHAYTKILRPMEGLMKEYEEAEDPLWGRLVHYKPYSSLLFEDLKASGYLLRRRQSCLDLEHGHLVLHSLGRLHGMAKVLEERGVIDGKDFKLYPVANDKHLIDVFLHCGLKTLSKAMEESWGPAWHGVAEKLRMPLEELEKKMLAIGAVDESRFNVWNHGDCWSNNILFRYDWKKRPIELRFLDFQISHYNSSCWDVTYFMFASIEPSIRREHYDALLKTYTTSLLSTLNKYHYGGRRPTHEEIVAEMERISLFRLAVVTMFHAIMTADTTEPIDMELVLTSGGASGHYTETYTSERYRTRVGPDLLEFAKQGII